MNTKIWNIMYAFILVIVITACVQSGPLTLTIQFDSQGIISYNPTTYTKGIDFQMPNPTDIEGYTFDGWFFDDAYEHPFEINQLNEYLGQGFITVYAKWLYTISFLSPSGPSLESISIIYPNRIAEPSTPTSVGYIFDGFYVDSSFSISFDFDNYDIRSTNIYVKWLVQTYTISFIELFGTDVSDIVADFGQSINLPIPERLGYSFDGWYVDPISMNERFDSTTMPATNLVLYAKWTESSDNFYDTVIFIDPITIDAVHAKLDVVIDVIDENIIGVDIEIIYDSETILLTALTFNLQWTCNIDQPGSIHCVYLNVEQILDSRYSLFSLEVSYLDKSDFSIFITIHELIGVNLDNQLYYVNYDIFNFKLADIAIR